MKKTRKSPRLLKSIISRGLGPASGLTITEMFNTKNMKAAHNGAVTHLFRHTDHTAPRSLCRRAHFSLQSTVIDWDGGTPGCIVVPPLCGYCRKQLLEEA